MHRHAPAILMPAVLMPPHLQKQRGVLVGKAFVTPIADGHAQHVGMGLSAPNFGRTSDGVPAPVRRQPRRVCSFKP